MRQGMRITNSERLSQVVMMCHINFITLFFYPGTILHEIGHALGFYHEQNRSDRDEHIEVNLDNVKSSYRGNFAKFPSQNNVTYDYNSVMHYGRKVMCPLMHFYENTIVFPNQRENEPPHDKTSKVTVRPVKTQISLGIRLVWAESSLCT